MRRTLLAATVVAGLSGLTGVVQAQNPAGTRYDPYPHFGLQVSYGDETDLGLGIRYENRPTSLFPNSPSLRLVGSFDYFFPDGNYDYWELNANVINLFRVQNARVVPYLGGGLNIGHTSNGDSDTDAGINLLAGIRLPGQYRPFLEGRLVLGGREQFVLTGGWLFW